VIFSAFWTVTIANIPAKNLYKFLNCLFYPSKISNLIIIQPEVFVFPCLLSGLSVRHCRATASRESGSALSLSCHWLLNS